MNTLKNLIISVFFLLQFQNGSAQNSPFSISLEELNIPNLGGLQSYAFGQFNGKWLIIGGRLDGLHQRQPFAAFDAAGHNTEIFVVDPVTLQKWSTPLTSLSVGLQEQLKSTNMQFHQNGTMLYIIGGYGYSATANNHTTFSNLTAVDIPNVITAIINNSTISGFFRQISDPQFQVTGGHLEKIYDTYYLVGGQKFIGRYNPIGPNNGPGFIQEYTEQIRRFKITDDGVTLDVTLLTPWTDALNLHRRDYNVTPQILLNGQEGLTAFSGVFQPTVNLPFLNSVSIDSTSYNVNSGFTQYYNHYHCANIPLHSSISNEMHYIFFGGIAQFYDNNGTMVQDNDVPFVKTIARITRDQNGLMSEYKLPIEMPSLLGAGSEFIVNPLLPMHANNVLKFDEFVGDTVLLGYIYGGISSTALNIFFTNTGTQSAASSQIFKVFLIKNQLGSDDLNNHSIGKLKLVVFPNPNSGVFKVKYTLDKPTSVQITLRSVDGKIVCIEKIKSQPAGEYFFEEKSRKLRFVGNYHLTIKTEFETATQTILIHE